MTMHESKSVLEAVVDSSVSLGLIPLYRKRAKRYDQTTLLYYIAGFRHWGYRKRAIQSLALNQGDTVVELGASSSSTSRGLRDG